MREKHKAFKDWLDERNLRFTPQRRTILETFLSCATHVTADSMYLKTKATDNSIGIATIYRTLKLLARSGLARERLSENGVAHYTPTNGAERHDHIICTVCGKRIKISNPKILELQKDLAASHDFLLTDQTLFLYGICMNCRNKRGN